MTDPKRDYVGYVGEGLKRVEGYGQLGPGRVARSRI